MDIGLIYPYLDLFGGAQKYFLECVKNWQKKHDLTVYCVTCDQNILDECEVDINVEYLNVPNNIFFEKRYLKYHSLLFKSKSISNQIGKHEIYNSHQFPCHILHLENNIWTPHDPSRRLYDLRTPLNDRSVPIHERILFNLPVPFLRWVDQRNYRAAVTIANSNYSKGYLEEVYSRKFKYVVYPGVDYKKYNQFNVEKDKNCILFVSRLGPGKGCEEAIAALQYLDDSFYLEVVGKGPFKEGLIDLAKRLNVIDRVHFNGFLTDYDLITLYKKSLCSVFLPYKEPFGMVALESLAAGTPVIGSNYESGFSELLEEGYNGFLLNKNSEEIAKEVASRIKFLHDNEDLYDKMVVNCRNTAKSHTWDETANQTMNIFKEYLNNK